MIASSSNGNNSSNTPVRSYPSLANTKTKANAPLNSPGGLSSARAMFMRRLEYKSVGRVLIGGLGGWR